MANTAPKPKSQRIGAEIEKIRERVAKDKEKLEILQKQMTDTINTEIVDAVRKVYVTPEEIFAFIGKMAEARQGGFTQMSLAESLTVAADLPPEEKPEPDEETESSTQKGKTED